MTLRSEGIPATETVPRRRVPEEPYSVSEITFDLSDRSIVDPDGFRTLAAELKRVRRRGVTSFDLAGASDLAGIGAAFRSAFPAPDPELTVIVADGPASPASRLRPPDSSTDGSRSRGEWWDRVRSAVGPSPGLLAEAAPSVRGDVRSDELRHLLGLKRDGVVRDVIVPAPELAGERTPAGTEPWRLRSTRVSLVDPERARRTVASREPSPHSWIARGVVDAARIDDPTRTAGRGYARPRPLVPTSPPLETLERSLERMRPFAFLTRGGRRTFLQASIQFALRWPAVITASLPLPAPERVDEVLAYRNAEPLTDDETDRLFDPSRRARTEEPSVED